jgi:CBS domain-containing protein
MAKNLTPQQTRLVGIAVVVQLVIGMLTLRDIKRRPAEQIRGPKWVWRFVGSANTAGSAAYWVLGRRR